MSANLLFNHVKIIKVICLLRVSTVGQASVQHGSLEQQKHSIMDYIDRLNKSSKNKKYEVLVFIEEDASAKHQNTHKRKDLKEIERLIRNGTAHAVFADRSDRLSRDLGYNNYFTKYILDMKAEYHEVQIGHIDFNKTDQLFGFIYRSFQAEQYSTELSKTIRTRGRTARVHSGKDSSTSPSYGLDPHETFACMYVINPIEININIFNKNIFIYF
jgi:DNA invertase Pin-like site-specific DNA recombinase